MAQASKLGLHAEKTREARIQAGPEAREIRFAPIDTLRTDPRNPRKHDRTQLLAIAQSIEAFGFNAPILIDSGNQVIAGHGRLEAAKLCGLKQVPVLSLDHLSEPKARAYMLADNKLADRSSWDEKVLASHLKDLSDLALDFDIEATGFELPEVDLLIQSLDPAETTDEQDLFAIPKGPAITAIGDVWILGRHRVLCESALNASVFNILLGDEKASCVFTDPPYNVPIKGHAGGKGATQHREFLMASGEMNSAEFSEFLKAALATSATHTAPGGLIYACMDWRHLEEMLTASRGAGFLTLNVCVWVKSNGGMGSLYRNRHEFVFVFRNGDTSYRNNVQLGRFGRNRTNVWHYAGANSFPRKGRQRGLDHHPTSKPIALVSDAILDCTGRDDIVLDPFLGAGTTILAAERTGRRGYGIELDPLYVDACIQRWQVMTGGLAIHATTGMSFETARSERGRAR